MLLALTTVLSVSMTACFGGGSDEDSSVVQVTPTPEPTKAAKATPTPAPANALMETNAKNNASNMVAFFDAEEETNSALGGADTPFFRNVLTKA